MSTPHTCPVCHGRGTVPGNFYSRLGVGANSNDLTTCRACSGAGVLWRPSVPYVPEPPEKPKDAPWRLDTGTVSYPPLGVGWGADQGGPE